MATLLLVIIFMDFIGLGIPDSLFGPAWPAIYTEMNLPVSLGSAVSLINTGGTVISSLMSARLIKRFGTAKVTAFSTVVTATALLGFSVSHEFIFLCLFSLPLGLGGGAIDAALNNYVSLHYRATHELFALFLRYRRFVEPIFYVACAFGCRRLALRLPHRIFCADIYCGGYCSGTAALEACGRKKRRGNGAAHGFCLAAGTLQKSAYDLAYVYLFLCNRMYGWDMGKHVSC